MASADSTNELAQCCGDLPRLENPSEYTVKGTIKKTPNSGIPYYEVAIDVKRTDLAVIQFYDIVGFESSQTKQQADRISAGLGCKVVTPDFFLTVLERTREIIEVLRGEGITKFAHVGHCWGGVQGVFLATVPDLFHALGLIHARTFTAEQGAKILVPIINLPSKNEGLQPEFHEALRPGVKELSEFHLYDDVPHGFSSGRSDWSDPLLKQRAEEVIQEYVTFIKKILPKPE
ncbi:hypothetical protein BS47DRAFT_1360806 [Hydnum rufescens UP504]|uniref:Dienelactone hydrolase domain-containing protein n=1 Tax=Hydnum rufescens UP504 TaxID=1448309 RepID=A0A9P6DYI0_9AGAM|nr:hypothetical protein BS47DRAFT_1360806 [Hydnum rufescens UP504]